MDAGTDDAQAQGEFLRSRYDLVVIKRGAAGCEAWSGARTLRVAAPTAAAIDTTGAGDAFVAGFLSARARGEGLEASLEAAVAAGTVATTFAGGRPAPR
jgi:sugar/nucleoside kinase (ribokinase family)